MLERDAGMADTEGCFGVVEKWIGLYLWAWFLMC